MKALLEEFFKEFTNAIMFDVLDDRSTMIFCTRTKLREDLEKAIKNNLRLYSFNLDNDEVKSLPAITSGGTSIGISLTRLRKIIRDDRFSHTALWSLTYASIAMSEKTSRWKLARFL